VLNAFAVLQVSEWDLERAIELFFETGGVDLSGPPPARPPPEPPQFPRHQTPPAGPGPVIVEDDDELDTGSGIPPAAQDTMDEDEALARRLMEEDLEQQETRGGPANDGVRSPIAARNDILVHPDTDYDNQYVFGAGRRGRGMSPSPLLPVRC
jgi:hypothetical protein